MMTLAEMFDLCRAAQGKKKDGQASMEVPVDVVIGLVRESLGLANAAFELIDERNVARQRSRRLHETLAQLVALLVDEKVEIHDAVLRKAIEIAEHVLREEKDEDDA